MYKFVKELTIDEVMLLNDYSFKNYISMIK